MGRVMGLLNRSEWVIPRRCCSAVRTGVGHIGSDSDGDHRRVVLDSGVVNRLPAHHSRSLRHYDGGVCAPFVDVSHTN